MLPTGAEDIGTWGTILQLISVAAVVTNAGIVCFTMKILNFGSGEGAVATVWVFIGFQYMILVAMGLFAYLVDDVPEEVILVPGERGLVIQLLFIVTLCIVNHLPFSLKNFVPCLVHY